MRSFVVLVVCALAATCSGAAAAAPAAAKPGCNGLLAFASLAHDAYSEIFSISLDGRRTVVSRTAGSAVAPQLSPDGSKLAFWTDGKLVVANADGSDPRQIPAGAGGAYTSNAIA